MAGKDFGHRHLRGAFDFLVRIDERHAEQARHLAADRRLAHAHHAHKHDRAVEPPGDPLNFGVREGVVVHCGAGYN